MKWTKELPEKEGWYWISDAMKINWYPPGMTEIRDGKDYCIDGLAVHEIRREMPISIKGYEGHTYFYGPVSPPKGVPDNEEHFGIEHVFAPSHCTPIDPPKFEQEDE